MEELKRIEINLWLCGVVAEVQPKGFALGKYFSHSRGYTFMWLGRLSVAIFWWWYEYPYLNDILYEIEPTDRPDLSRVEK